MRTEDIRSMLVLQNELNSVVHPEWTKQGFKWRHAIMVESAELLDHWGWKWWKHQTPNVPQAHIELVDIWHFLLSQTLEALGDVGEAAAWIKYQWDRPVWTDRADPRMVVEEFVRGVLSEAHPQIQRFHQLCQVMSLAPMHLHSTYIAKNVLNIFRQRNGYKDGSYVKVWNGREDNEVLTDFMVLEDDPHALLDLLQLAYADVGSR